MVPAVCILQGLQKINEEEDTFMFVSEQSGNFDKWDQWILEKCLGEVVLKADSRHASWTARERSWQSPILTAEVGKDPE